MVDYLEGKTIVNHINLHKDGNKTYRKLSNLIIYI